VVREQHDPGVEPLYVVELESHRSPASDRVDVSIAPNERVRLSFSSLTPAQTADHASLRLMDAGALGARIPDRAFRLRRRFGRDILGARFGHQLIGIDRRPGHRTQCRKTSGETPVLDATAESSLPCNSAMALLLAAKAGVIDPSITNIALLA
jgi:hypothetical protein